MNLLNRAREQAVLSDFRHRLLGDECIFVIRSVTVTLPSAGSNSKPFMLGLSIPVIPMRQTGVYLRKFAIFVHRWLGLAFCLLFALWFVSGIVMMYSDYPGVS